ncbi:MAG TPA: nucleotidyltransferase family protein [Hyphomicrobiales bacterium]|nr:nucleotidyltransferase family protein [Rhodobiaceae bacterium]HXK53703.1 nucleotidyltransferase family protein [Hyphomicrobiales bacterium]
MTLHRHRIRIPATAMVLAAGKGLRMRPLTETRPKPLVKLAGKTLLDRALDLLDATIVRHAIVNVHYLGEQIIDHVKTRIAPAVLISDERGELLDTGGGIAKALPLIGSRPFFLINSDSTWRDGPSPALLRLAEMFDEKQMDGVLLLIAPERGIGFDGPGDFRLGADRRLTRAGAGDTAALAYMGVAILSPKMFAGAPRGAFSLNILFDRAIAAGRLFGLVHEGDWMHVGTPQALRQAEEFLAATTTR